MSGKISRVESPNSIITMVGQYRRRGPPTAAVRVPKGGYWKKGDRRKKIQRRDIHDRCVRGNHGDGAECE